MISYGNERTSPLSKELFTIKTLAIHIFQQPITELFIVTHCMNHPNFHLDTNARFQDGYLEDVRHSLDSLPRPQAVLATITSAVGVCSSPSEKESSPRIFEVDRLLTVRCRREYC